MEHDTALEKRNQLIKDGYCVVEGILTEDFLDELRRETDRMLDSVEHPPEWKYQGSNLSVRGSVETGHRPVNSLAADVGCAECDETGRFPFSREFHYP